MSKKVTDGRISYQQYRLADLMLFLLIMCGCEIINVLAIRKWFTGQLFSISVMMLVTLLVMVRWNFWAALFPVVDGVLVCALAKLEWKAYLIYCIGSLLILAVWFLLKIGKDKLKKWYWLLLYVFLGFVATELGRSLMALCLGYPFIDFLAAFLGYGELLSFVFSFVALLLLSKINGLVCDQKTYLKEEAYKRDNPRAPEEYHWDGYTELNEDDLAALSAMDEYDRALGGKRKRLKNDEPAEESFEADEVSELEELESSEPRKSGEDNKPQESEESGGK